MTTYEIELCFTLPPSEADKMDSLERVTILTHPGRPNSNPERWLLHISRYGQRIKAILRLDQGEKVSAVIADGAPIVFHVTHLTGPYGRKGA